MKNSLSFAFATGSRWVKYLSLSLVALVVAACLSLLPVLSASSGDAATAPIHVIGRIRLEIPESKYEEYELKTAALFTSTAKIDHPSLYTCSRDINDPDLYVWDEEWSSYDALKVHLASSHFNDWYSYVKEFQVGDLNVIYAPVSAFKAV